MHIKYILVYTQGDFSANKKHKIVLLSFDWSRKASPLAFEGDAYSWHYFLLFQDLKITMIIRQTDTILLPQTADEPTIT